MDLWEKGVEVDTGCSEGGLDSESDSDLGEAGEDGNNCDDFNDNGDGGGNNSNDSVDSDMTESMDKEETIRVLELLIGEAGIGFDPDHKVHDAMNKLVSMLDSNGRQKLLEMLFDGSGLDEDSDKDNDEGSEGSDINCKIVNKKENNGNGGERKYKFNSWLDVQEILNAGMKSKGRAKCTVYTKDLSVISIKCKSGYGVRIGSGSVISRTDINKLGKYKKHIKDYSKVCGEYAKRRMLTSDLAVAEGVKGIYKIFGALSISRVVEEGI